MALCGGPHGCPPNCRVQLVLQRHSNASSGKSGRIAPREKPLKRPPLERLPVLPPNHSLPKSCFLPVRLLWEQVLLQHLQRLCLVALKC